MGVEISKSLWWVVALFMVQVLQQIADGNQQVHCHFIFGDSLADNGNNNFLDTLAKVNYSPYGIDYLYGPTGRFTNGRATIDVIAELLGFENFIPSFATAYGTDILFGVNYASGSAGIRNETGSSCLHDYGARKIALFGLGLIGCTPNAVEKYGTNGSICVEIMEEASLLFNKKLKSVVEELNSNLTDAKFIYINYYAVGADSSLLGKPPLNYVNFNYNYVYTLYHILSFGADFKDTSSGCCTVASDGQCIANQIPCKNRTEYAFWDSFHPTEAVNKFIAESSYSALEPSDAYPFDIHNLVLLNL
ncbi:GDSL esterase/lipase At5g45670-like [Hevea brasiliensis]|uniref:GDSL esterase/lipase At5g45670-like n=1 Tax=Hevea brasiliensis TaxID=3981 RepID=UPI0026013854|nr:GDSL esterase/lipase At5g45670-like [Hevea brasiliensis]